MSASLRTLALALVGAAVTVVVPAGCSDSSGTGSDAAAQSSGSAGAASPALPPATSLPGTTAPPAPPATPAPGPAPRRGTVEVVRTLPHDAHLFTEGLQVVGDQVYESTGMERASQVQRRPLAGGAPSAVAALPPQQFGEGVAVTDTTAWSLTWKDGIAYNRDPQTLQPRSTVHYEGEGWGLCTTGSQLVMSNGTDVLTFRDPVTFAPTRTIAVTAGGAPVSQLNELECSDGTILANVWTTNDVVRIDPATGQVTVVYDASALGVPRPTDPDAVLNGIAALPNSENVLLTGKYWPSMYEVRLVG